MKFSEKMKDVELNPYMLTIYKDNEHHHLLRHAIECWKLRPRPTGPINNILLARNPILYHPKPPLDLVQKYYPGENSYVLLISRILNCPIVARYAFWENFDRLCEIARQFDCHGDSNLDRTINLISFSQDEVYQIVSAGLLPIMPWEFHLSLTSEQRSVAAICA